MAQGSAPLKQFQNKHHVPKYPLPSNIYHLSTNSYEFEKPLTGELESTSENPTRHISLSLQDTRQHLTETTRMQPPVFGLYVQSPIKNPPYEDYTDSAFKIVPQTIAQVNPVTPYTPNSIAEIAVPPTDSPVTISTTKTTFIDNHNDTLLTELIQKLQGNNQPQSQLSSDPDHVDVDYSIISLFKILNDFKRAKGIIGSSPDHQYYVQSDDKDAVDDSHESPQNGSINAKNTLI